MESQKEARRIQEPVEWLPGASRSQTQKDKERWESGTVPAVAVLGAEADDTSVDGLRELLLELTKQSPKCSRCR